METRTEPIDSATAAVNAMSPSDVTYDVDHADQSGDPVVLASWTDADGSQRCEPVQFRALKRTHLQRLASVAFPDFKGSYWGRAKNADILEALATGNVPEIVAQQAAFDSATGNGHAPQVLDMGAPEDAASAAVEALRALVATSRASVDPETVRKIAGAMIDEKAGEILAKIEALAPRAIEVRNTDTGHAKRLELVHETFPDVLALVSCRIPVYLFGPCGTGKSTIARQVAEALDLEFSSESFSPDKDSTYLLGFVDAGGTYHETAFLKRYRDGGVFLFDEIDNCDAQILAVLNEALANGSMEFPGIGRVKRHADFVGIAAGNTWGSGPDSTFIGRTAIDAATLDRFASVHVPIDLELERAAALSRIEDKAKGGAWIERVRTYRAAAERRSIQVVVSPRASILGCAMIGTGWTPERCETAFIFRGLSSDIVAQLKGN